MSSATTGAYFVSCVSGNKNNDLLCWVLLFLLPKFLGTPFAYINFLLIQAIDRSPSAVGVLGNFGVFSGFTKGGYKPSQTHLLFPANLPDTVNTEHVELDFSDVFGPVTVDLNNIDCTTGEPVEDVNELVYDDPPVIHTRSHSLVGPSTCVSQSLKLSKLTIHETEDSLELVDYVDEETFKDIKESSFVEESLKDEDGNISKTQRVSIEDFDILKVVGQGAFAKVYQVRKKGTSEIYAMKVMRKDKIMEKNHTEYMKAERDIWTKIEHPFVVQLRYCFQTKYRLYLVLDFVNGGHLFFQLYHQGLFREDLARIYAAEIVSAVSHLHSNGIMHRDLKPENILLDADGHVMLTDFGLAKQFEESTRSNSMCGTLEYMAPEIILGKGHDKAADWWSVGVLLFEMLTGKPPFCGGSRDKIQQKIVKDKIKLPAFLSSEAHSLLKALLQKEATKRLGCGARGVEEIKGHKWFKPINWRKLEERAIEPSFRPEVAGTHCVANFEKRWTDMPVVDSPAASPNGGNPFKDFSYVRPAPSFLQRNSPAY
ncbi:non-specific serine/threonine protein kinase [Vigna unguiculata]|uniref:non-specific serine/threonine protein kinase n=1 Tax=Vigna unguiculata TaxID=3917 RepID=A0A4D6NE54_VIGUN|nr:non-specific serine/threonine protein kinase [Vigna unguiculata]